MEDISFNPFLFYAIHMLIYLLGDACTPNPCLNGAVCISNAFGGFTCQCPPEFTGQRCEDRKTLFTFSVATCFFSVCLGDACASQPCMNGGTCMKDNGGFRCVCPPGYSGSQCEIRDACQSNPCMNGGTCQAINGNGGYQCICPPGFNGLRCETSMHTTCF